MTGRPLEWEVQDALADLCQRFDPFHIAGSGERAADLAAYLHGQGYPPAVAALAASRHALANDA